MAAELYLGRLERRSSGRDHRLLTATLKGWQGWLEINRLELVGQPPRRKRSQAGDMMEVADLRERARKLESIAACADL